MGLLDILNNFGKDTVKDLQTSMDVSGVNATGKTRNSIAYRIKENGVTVFADSNIEKIEMGTAPNSQVTPQEIKEWALSKPVNIDQRNIDQFAFYTAKKINNKGSLLWYTTDFYNRTRPSGIISNVIDDGRVNTLVSNLGREIKNLFINTFKDGK